jgi:hypothetical protein
MEQSLILNDGMILAPAHAILAGGVLWVYLDGGISLAEAFELLIDPEKTELITANEFGTVTEYVGYTDLFCITREENGQVNAGLKKAVN